MNATRKKSDAGYSSSLLGVIGWAIPLVVALAAAMYLTQTRQTEDSRLKTRARDEIRAMSAALAAGRADDKPLPGTQEGLQALVDDGTLAHVPKDPWGHSYQYRNPGTERSWELYSLGPDGIESRDDIVSWNLYGGR